MKASRLYKNKVKYMEGQVQQLEIQLNLNQ